MMLMRYEEARDVMEFVLGYGKHACERKEGGIQGWILFVLDRSRDWGDTGDTKAVTLCSSGL